MNDDKLKEILLNNRLKCDTTIDDKINRNQRICDLRNFNHLDRENKLEEDINNLYKQFRFCFAYTCIVNLILIGVMICLILTN